MVSIGMLKCWSPCLFRWSISGFSVDWWALGVLLYEMLAGRSPFDVERASENPDQVMN